MYPGKSPYHSEFNSGRIGEGLVRNELGVTLTAVDPRLGAGEDRSPRRPTGAYEDAEGP